MGQQVNFYLYRVKKAINTTWRPANYEDGTRVDGYIIHPCSIIKPIFKLSYPQGQEIQYYTYNFAYVPIFKRWYWVKDVVFQDGLMEFHLEVDVLASYRADIAAHNFFITRTSVSSDGDIIDTLYPVQSGENQHRQSYKLFTGGNWYAGAVIVTIVGQDASLKYLVFSMVDFETFCRNLFSTIDWANLNTEEISESIAKLAVNPFQYITNVMWVPQGLELPVSEIKNTVKIGYWDVYGEHSELQANLIITKTLEVTTQAHPQASRGDFLNHNRFNQISLFSPIWGVMNIDSNKIKGGGAFTVQFNFDPRSGHCEVMVTTATAMLGYYTGMFAVPVPIANIESNPFQAIVGAIGAVGSLVTGNIGGVSAGIGNAVNEIMPSVETKGAQGAIFGARGEVVLTQSFHLLSDEDNADNGRPYMKNGNMHTLGEGFYMVENGNIPIAGATEEEATKVKEFLERGVYYNV